MAVNVDIVATTGYRASKLLGSEIYNHQGEKIGKIDDFIVGSDEKVSVAAVTAYILGILLNQQQDNAAVWRSEIRRRIGVPES